MGLVDVVTLLGIADRAARQYGFIATAFTSINLTSVSGGGSGGEFFWRRVTDGDDPDLEIPMLEKMYDLDTNGFTLATAFKAGLPKLLYTVTAMDTHFTRVGHSGGWDSYLNAVSERVSDYFNQVYYAAKSQYLLANNVFSEDTNTFATWEYVLGADDYTAGTDYGNGSWTNRANGSYFAPTQLKAVVHADSNTCSSLILTLTVRTPGNTLTTVDTPAISGGAGTSVNVGTSASRYLAVTNVVAKSGASNGNKVVIQNIIERDVDNC